MRYLGSIFQFLVIFGNFWHFHVKFIQKLRSIPPGSQQILLDSSPGYQKNIMVNHRNGGAGKKTHMNFRFTIKYILHYTDQWENAKKLK